MRIVRREPLVGLLAALLLVVGLRLAYDMYRWWAFQDERATIERLQTELEEVGLGVVTSRLGIDSVRVGIAVLDAELAEGRSEIASYERRIGGGNPSPELQTRYREALDSHNRRVRERNELVAEWRAAVRANHTYVDRYNTIADSVRLLAARLGEPHFPVRTPAEIADELGLLANPPALPTGPSREVGVERM